MTITSIKAVMSSRDFRLRGIGAKAPGPPRTGANNPPRRRGLCTAKRWWAVMGIVTSACAGGPAVPGPPVWDAVALSFLPTAINDSGIIIGTENGAPVKRSGSGDTTPLPLLGGVSGPYVPVDLNSSGVTLGSTSNGNFPGVLWTSSLQTIPMGSAPVGVFVPRAINSSVVVVGGSDDAQQAFRWAANVIGYTALGPPAGYSSASATDVNDAGYELGRASCRA